MATAKQLPSGNWRCRAAFTDEEGVQHIESFTAETKRRAEALAFAWQEGMIEKKKFKTKQPLGEAIDAYLETCRCVGLSPATIRSYKASRNNAFASILSRPIDRITVKEMQKWANERSKVVAPKTLKNNLALLSAVFKAEDVNLDFDAIKLPKVSHQEMDIPSDSQVAMLLNDVYEDDNMYIAIALAALMGLRRSEICALKWSDILIQDGVAYLDVSKALVLDEHAEHVEKTPKTDAGFRILPIPKALYELVRRRIPDNIRLFFIPPYTPEMNPIEQIWKEIRLRGFRNHVFPSLNKVVDRLCETIRNLSAETIQSISGRQWIIGCFD